MNHAYRGRIRILGKKLKAYRGNELYKHTLAMLPQNPQTVFIKESVREDYKEMQKVMEYSDSEMDRQVEEVEKLLGISALMDKHPYDLSGGEQQKPLWERFCCCSRRSCCWMSRQKVSMLIPSIVWWTDEKTAGGRHDDPDGNA